MNEELRKYVTDIVNFACWFEGHKLRTARLEVDKKMRAARKKVTRKWYLKNLEKQGKVPRLNQDKTACASNYI